MILRFVNFLMIAVFLLAVIVQYNDTNPIRWMLIYGAACVLCILFAMKKLDWIAATILAAISAIWALMKMPELTAAGFRHMLDDVHMTQQGVESAREFLGLVIVLVWVSTLAISVYCKEQSESASRIE